MMKMKIVMITTMIMMTMKMITRKKLNMILNPITIMMTMIVMITTTIMMTTKTIMTMMTQDTQTHWFGFQKQVISTIAMTDAAI